MTNCYENATVRVGEHLPIELEIPFAEALRAVDQQISAAAIGEVFIYRAQPGSGGRIYQPSDLLVLRNAARVFRRELRLTPRGLIVEAT